MAAGALVGDGCAEVATTDSSVVGNSAGALSAGSGVAAGLSLAGNVVGPALIFASVSCCSFSCCCNVLTVSVSACTCWRKASTSLGDDAGVGCCCPKTTECAQSSAAAINFFFTIILLCSNRRDAPELRLLCERTAFGAD